MKEDKYYQKDTFQMTPVITVVSVTILVALMAWLWLSTPQKSKVEKLSSQPIAETLQTTEINTGMDQQLEVIGEMGVEDKEPEQKAIEPTVPSDPLPEINASDPAAIKTANELSLDGSLVKLLVPERIILKFVRAILALDEGNVVKDFRPINSPQGTFAVIKIDEPLDIDVGQRYQIDPKNYQRYEKYIELFSSLDKQQLAAAYKRYYPLLEEGYLQYGEDRGGFDAVLNRVIERIVSTKSAGNDFVLVQPKVFYVFEDKQIENKSAVEKLLIRIGPKNTKQLKEQLILFKKSL